MVFLCQKPSTFSHTPRTSRKHTLTHTHTNDIPADTRCPPHTPQRHTPTGSHTHTHNKQTPRVCPSKLVTPRLLWLNSVSPRIPPTPGESHGRYVSSPRTDTGEAVLGPPDPSSSESGTSPPHPSAGLKSELQQGAEPLAETALKTPVSGLGDAVGTPRIGGTWGQKQEKNKKPKNGKPGGGQLARTSREMGRGEPGVYKGWGVVLRPLLSPDPAMEALSSHFAGGKRDSRR